MRKFYHLEEEADTKLSGQMAIVRDVLKKYIVRLLEIDEDAAPFTILSMEFAHEATFEIDTTTGPIKLGLRGLIDRVDQQGQIVRLIDYKSGGDKKNFPNVESLFDRENKQRNKAAMQTMFYGLLYQSMFPSNTMALKPALFNFKEIFQDDFNPYLQEKSGRSSAIEVNDYRDYQKGYENGLKNLLEEMYHPEVPFDQTDDLEKCKYCAYKEICGR
ncbi:MAG: PD-(D/E)XK nuclease family protein [Cyclobacteriaceae bacterium]|nr:PD-(D/E)XK nuclease family protein [Cyclobacteriaceae bacterium]